MKQTTKITLLSIWSIIATIIIVVATGIFAIKNTWRIAPDFSLCEDPYEICPIVQDIGDDYVRLSTMVIAIGYRFQGYTYEIKKNENTLGYTLYVGIKYVPLFGDEGPGARIFISKSTNEKITKIVACGHGKERVIYDSSSESDQDKLQDSTNTSSEATSSLN